MPNLPQQQLKILITINLPGSEEEITDDVGSLPSSMENNDEHKEFIMWILNSKYLLIHDTKSALYNILYVTRNATNCNEHGLNSLLK